MPFYIYSFTKFGMNYQHIYESLDTVLQIMYHHLESNEGYPESIQRVDSAQMLYNSRSDDPYTFLYNNRVLVP